MPDVNGDLTSWFERHLVTLEVSYTVKHQNKTDGQTRIFITGFLLSETLSGDEGVMVRVTAGHFAGWIDRDLLGEPEHYGDVRFRLDDTLHSASVYDIPSPLITQQNQPRAGMCIRASKASS